MCNTLNIKALELYCNIKKWNIELDTLIITCRMRTLMELTIINQVVIYGTTMIVVLFLSHMFTLYVEPRLNLLTNKIVRAFS